jgi:Cys-rich protein (TIGR01571 family)
MSLLCPGITLAQISARLGLLSYLTVMGCWFLLLLLAIVASFITSGFMDTIVVIGAFIMSASCWRLRWRVRKLFSIPGSVVEDLLYTLFCGCCSIAQMASHVESYTPGACTWSPRNTLEGYNGN